MMLLSTRTTIEDDDKNTNNANELAKHKNNANEVTKHRNDAK